MLVLRRKAGEAIVLNGVITIHVLAVEGERVKLGISAPPEVVIVRSELLENQGTMPQGPAQSGPYWPNRDVSRPPRDKGTSPSGPEGRAGVEQDPREATPGWSDSGKERTVPSPVLGAPHSES